MAAQVFFLSLSIGFFESPDIIGKKAFTFIWCFPAEGEFSGLSGFPRLERISESRGGLGRETLTVSYTGKSRFLNGKRYFRGSTE